MPKTKKSDELIQANLEMAFQNAEKEKRAAELRIANVELDYQNEEKEKRAAELLIANVELDFQTKEKENRAAELVVANVELDFQNEEKEKRAAELVVANKELLFQNGEKEKRAAELIIANKELASQNRKKEKRAAELIIANKELAFQNKEKEKRAAELLIANEELAFQNQEKEKRAAELLIANTELAFQNEEKEKRAAELSIANTELIFQNLEKEKRAAELLIANKELAFQNEEKEKRAAELIVANKELAFQNEEKEKRAAELSIANKELVFQNEEKEKRAAELIIANYARSLIEASLDPLVTISAAGKILDVNEASIKVTGVPREKLIDTDFSDYFTEPKKAQEGYLQVFEKGFVSDYPLTIKHKNGNLTDVLYNATVYKDDKGNVLGVFAAARDVTEQKWAIDLRIANKELAFQNEEKEKRAAELVIANKELILQNQEKEILLSTNRQKQKENKILESTLSDLKAAQSQLIQSEKMASLGGLAAGIAHEIQNPLNFVNNFSEVSTELIDEMNEEMENGNMEEVRLLAKDVKENLEKILHHGKRADAIVKGMLQHSRSSTGVKEPTNINALADEYFRLAYHGLRAKDKSFNATMKTDFDEHIGEISVIPQDLGRVILNLITNAFYAVAEKKKEVGKGFEPQVSVSTKKVGKRVLISVKDNGKGIPPQVLDKIFQPFFTTKPAGAGTGLGLSLSYDIIKAHGGELKVVTKEGEGTDFRVTLVM